MDPVSSFIEHGPFAVPGARSIRTDDGTKMPRGIGGGLMRRRIDRLVDDLPELAVITMRGRSRRPSRRWAAVIAEAVMMNWEPTKDAKKAQQALKDAILAVSQVQAAAKKAARK